MSLSSAEYKVIADVIVSPDPHIVVQIDGHMYRGDIAEQNRYALMSDVGQGGGGPLVIPFIVKDENGDDLLSFQKGGTGVTRIHAVQDDLALRSARDILLYAGDDGPGKVYIGWGDANYTPNATNEVATVGYVDNATGASSVKYITWGYPSNGAIAIMPATDDESIALKSSDSAAIRWHVRNIVDLSISPTSAVVTQGDGNYQVVFTIPEQTSVPPTGEYYYHVYCPNNSGYDASLYAVNATTTSITFYYATDPGEFDPSGAYINLPSVYAQYQVDSDGAHIKIANWTSDQGSYSKQWTFTKEGAIHFPYQTSNSRTGYGDVLQFAASFDQSIITGAPATSSSPTANRLVIAGQDGSTNGEGTDGEGGDIYVWAGQGGGTTGNGGDVKIDGGNGASSGQGGYVKVRGGHSTNGQGGFVEISAGDSYTQAGGDISITAGASNNGEGTPGGDVTIAAGYSSSAWAGGNMTLTTYSSGKITFSGAGGEFLNDSSNPDNQIATISDVAAVSTGSLTSVGTNILPSTDNTYTLGDATHRWESIHVGPGTLYITDQTLGTEAGLTVDNGVLQIDGANQLQVGQLKFVDNNIQSTTSEIEIEIGTDTDVASLILNRDTAIGQTLTVGNADATTNEITLSGLPMIGQIKSEVFGVGENGWAAEVSLQRHSNTFPVILSGSRSFGDTETDVDVEVGESLFLLMANGYAGTEYKNFANILFKVESDGDVAVSDTSSPGMIEFQVAPNRSTSPITALTVHADQTVEHANGDVWGAEPPTTSVGSAGDRYGMVAYDDNYAYRCCGNYDGIADIWKRVALTGGSW